MAKALANATATSRALPTGPVFIEGEAPVVAAARKQALNLPESVCFTWMLNPFALDVYLTPAGPKVLPRPLAVPHAGGVGRATENFAARGKVVGSIPQGDVAPALVAYGKDGWLPVPENFECIVFRPGQGRQRKPEKARGYARRFTNRQGQSVWLELWRRPYMVGNRVSFDVDQQGRWETLELMREQLLGPFDRNALIELRERLLNHYRRVQHKKTGFGPEDKRLYALKLEAFKAYDLYPFTVDAADSEDVEDTDSE